MMTDRHLLLISGPSGGGKSVFIQQLKSDQLNEAILRELPTGCRAWPIIEANNMMKDDLSEADLMAQGGATDRALAHYDITFIHRFAIADYASDPFCAGLLHKSKVCIIFVKPDVTRLLAQYFARQEQHSLSKSKLSRTWAKWVRSPIKRAARLKQGIPFVEAHELYNSPAFLDGCYAKWEAYLSRLAMSAHEVRIIVVRPMLSEGGKPSFVLEDQR